MEISEARERLKELESLISRQVMAFEKETVCRVIDIHVTRLTTINEQPDGYSYVKIRAEL